MNSTSHYFYESRHDILTDWRVHHIASINDAMGKTPAANGILYRNNLNPFDVIINGRLYAVTFGDIQREELIGAPGKVSILHRRNTTLITTVDAMLSSYYDDNAVAPANNCTRDRQAWGTSRISILFTNITVHNDLFSANTDAYRQCQSHRLIYVDSSGSGTASAGNYNLQWNNPLVTTVASYVVSTSFPFL